MNTDNISKKIPVVVVLGHIDHGKSSLLEAIRKDFQITAKESGGITQHVGAYEAKHEGKKECIIDTPGHEAFSGMRSRGAKIADIAILVVAADEGVKPQTKEAIEVIKKADIPTIIALNKIDKENADPQRVKGELQNAGILIEEWGGDVPLVEVSAKTGKGIDELLSTLNVLAEVLELKADLKSKPSGFVLESHLDSLVGPQATLIIEEGTLNVGDPIMTDSTCGKIRTMRDFAFKEKNKALPGEAVIVTGLKDAPTAGEKFLLAKSLDDALKIISEKKQKECFFEFKEKEGIERYLNVVLKTDVRGCAEVLIKILNDLVQDRTGIKILKVDVGDISDSDVRLADHNNAIIIGFRVKPTPVAESQSKQRGVDILLFDVIYELVDTLRKEMEKRVEKRKERVNMGKLKPLVIFKTQKKGERNYRQIIGGKVVEGEIRKGEVEIQRGEEVLFGGKIIEIQENKKVIEKAKAGKEVGIRYEGKTKVKEGDILIIYEIIEV